MSMGAGPSFSVLLAQGHTGGPGPQGLLRKAAWAGVLLWAPLAPAAPGPWGIFAGVCRHPMGSRSAKGGAQSAGTRRRPAGQGLHPAELSSRGISRALWTEGDLGSAGLTHVSVFG